MSRVYTITTVYCYVCGKTICQKYSGMHETSAMPITCFHPCKTEAGGRNAHLEVSTYTGKRPKE
jgi:hypothetical protein